jgi:putative FmdB family regulatory protein
VPVYQYKCKECGKVTEIVQKITDKPLTEHAQLGSKCLGKIVKQICPSALVFKGAGFYCNDYGKKSGEKN